MQLVTAAEVSEEGTIGYSILSVFFDSTAGGANENVFLKTVFDSFDTREEADVDDRKAADLRKLMTSSLDLSNYWTYEGS